MTLHIRHRVWNATKSITDSYTPAMKAFFAEKTNAAVEICITFAEKTAEVITIDAVVTENETRVDVHRDLRSFPSFPGFLALYFDIKSGIWNPWDSLPLKLLDRDPDGFFPSVFLELTLFSDGAVVGNADPHDAHQVAMDTLLEAFEHGDETALSNAVALFPVVDFITFLSVPEAYTTAHARMEDIQRLGRHNRLWTAAYLDINSAMTPFFSLPVRFSFPNEEFDDDW